MKFVTTEQQRECCWHTLTQSVKVLSPERASLKVWQRTYPSASFVQNDNEGKGISKELLKDVNRYDPSSWRGCLVFSIYLVLSICPMGMCCFFRVSFSPIFQGRGIKRRQFFWSQLSKNVLKREIVLDRVII